MITLGLKTGHYGPWVDSFMLVCGLPLDDELHTFHEEGCPAGVTGEVTDCRQLGDCDKDVHEMCCSICNPW